MSCWCRGTRTIFGRNGQSNTLRSRVKRAGAWKDVLPRVDELSYWKVRNALERILNLPVTEPQIAQVPSLPPRLQCFVQAVRIETFFTWLRRRKGNLLNPPILVVIP